MFTVLFMAIAIVLFPAINFADRASAAVEGVSGNKIVLTGLVSNSPNHYFVDDNGVSTLVNASLKNCGQPHYSIVSSSGASSGSAEYSATTDIQPFITAGLLYAQASAQVEIDGGTVQISISSGENSLSAQTSKNGTLKTELLPITSFNNIRFEFEANANSGFEIGEPTIHLFTVINEVVLNTPSQQVTPSQLIKIDAYNDVTRLSGQSGNFMYFSKINHQIKFDFSAGEQYVQQVGTNLIINSDAPEGAQITFRVYSNKNSYSNSPDDVVRSNYITFTVHSGVQVEVHTNFENPATVTGEGNYAENRYISLNVQPHAGYSFAGWYVNGTQQTTSTKMYYNVHAGDYIYAKFIKQISVSRLVVKSRVYNGSADISTEDVAVEFDGVEVGHMVGLSGATYYYADAQAGANKMVLVSIDKLTLTGDDAEIYSLASNTIPTSYGTITPRNTVVTPQAAQKQYRNADPILKFNASNLAEGEQSLRGSLGRQPGEELGRYNFTLGNLAEQNPNYNITLRANDVYFEIIPRVLNLSGVDVAEKVYDGTVDAQISAQLDNVYGNEEVFVELQGQFASANVGNSILVSITNATLKGKDKNNYTLSEYTKPIYGTITKRNMVVRANDCTFVYGEPLLFTYNTEGMLNFDSLTGELTLTDRANVGEHQIALGSLNNDNYNITFVPAICTIVERTLYVDARPASKPYGNQADPELTYTLSNLVDGDTLQGKLSRVEGEDVGYYSILQGDLFNPNYNIVFTGNIFEITKREIVVDVQFLDKVYNGQTDVEFVETYSNNIKNEEFSLQLSAHLSQADCGVASVLVDSASVAGEAVKNYTFIFNYPPTQEVLITRRRVSVLVDPLSKTYGDADPAFSFTTNNLVEGDSLVGKIARNSGENVGNYGYYLDTLDNFNNPNYSIYLEQGYFEIKPKQLRLEIESREKFFGDADPNFKFNLLTELAFEDSAENLFSGKVSRQAGESVGVYYYDVSTLSAGANYVCVIDGNPHFIINKRQVNVISKPATKVYGDDDPIFEYFVENDVEGERLSVQIRREYGEDSGSYQLICATNNDLRYNINFVPAELTITAAPIGIKVDENIKVYGDNDPVYSFIITSGMLKNNDRLDNLVRGEFDRQPGEDVGSYVVTQGSFSLGDNYSISFEEGSLRIIQKEITVSARASGKIYGDADPELKYDITQGELSFNDQFVGSLKRFDGEDVYSYKIEIGSLAVNNNYIINFVSNWFKITPREIEIIPTNPFKHYGDQDELLTYTIKGNLVEGDVLEGGLYRETGETSPEEVGKYLIHSTLKHKNYKVVLNECYYSILSRDIVVVADSVSFVYGQEEPSLNYHIQAGTILPGDSLTGEIYREEGNNVGEYNIISTLTINKNYNIVFVKGIVKILPVELTLSSKNYTKIYGQTDPKFSYEIVKGQLVGKDELYGSIGREQGEEIGNYNLICAIYNANYNITLLPAQLSIVKKDVQLIATVFDKIFDGTTKAKIRNPYLMGLLDKNVFLNYDIDNCADFETSEVGNDIRVILHDITLTGSKAKNYNLVYPSNIVGSITNKQLSQNGVVVSTQGTSLHQDYSLKVESQSVNNSILKIKNQKSLLMVNIWLESNSEQVLTEGDYTISIKLPNKVYDNSNIYVYQKLKDGGVKLISSHKGGDGNLVLSASGLGEFYITTTNESWLNYASYFAGATIVLVLCLIVANIIKNKKKKR